MADAILRIAGERIATPVCALARNDMVFVMRSTNLGAESKFTLSLRTSPQAGVAIRIPSIHRMLTPKGRSVYTAK